MFCRKNGHQHPQYDSPMTGRQLRGLDITLEDLAHQGQNLLDLQGGHQKPAAKN